MDLTGAVHRFLAGSCKPCLCEPGEEPIQITSENFCLAERAGALFLEAWDEHRNVIRRVTALEAEKKGKLTLRVERFPKRVGTVSLIDFGRPENQIAITRVSRHEFRDAFALFLRRRFPAYKLAELSTEPDLHESLSPVYPRALLCQGHSGWAAIGCPPSADAADGILSFGLVWLDYLRRREAILTIRGLILLLPWNFEKITCLRLAFLDRKVAAYLPFVYTEDGADYEIDISDYGNLDTHLEPCRRPLPSPVDQGVLALSRQAGVEALARPDGEWSLRVRGLEFARTLDGDYLLGIDHRKIVPSSEVGQLVQFADALARIRNPSGALRIHSLYTRNPELWLESQVRAEIEEIDATLRRDRIYGQVPAFAAGNRGVIDLLSVDGAGRLALLELKASEDIHLPLQALDYWMRVEWHLRRGEFGKAGYFPGIELRSDPPRILLISPALDVHPTNERILRYLSPSIEIEQIGVGSDWRDTLKVMFRRAVTWH